jgi:hypothetical protein
MSGAVLSTIGVLHPGEMGAAIGATLTGRGLTVLWAGEGRSEATGRRAESAGLRDAGTLADLCAQSDVLLSICPPHAALDVANAVAKTGFAGTYVDANAISPALAEQVARAVGEARFVDGGVIGPPPRERGATRLYLSGAGATELAGLLDGGALEAIALAEGGTTAASALKMSYAAWTKGTAALLLALRATAQAHGVEQPLLAEWARSQPELAQRCRSAQHSAETKGWRWTAEMIEIAATFAAAGQPDGFHQAAATVYERYERP